MLNCLVLLLSGTSVPTPGGPGGWSPRGLLRPRLGPEGLPSRVEGGGAGDRRGSAETATEYEASKVKPACKAVGGGAQRRVCRGETQVCKAGGQPQRARGQQTLVEGGGTGCRAQDSLC